MSVRERLIEALEKAEVDNTGIIMMTREFRDVLVEDMKEAVWTRVEDGLPEDDDSYLVLQWAPEAKLYGYDIAAYDPNKGSWYKITETMGIIEMEGVGYWKKLPNMPGGVEQ